VGLHDVSGRPSPMDSPQLWLDDGGDVNPSSKKATNWKMAATGSTARTASREDVSRPPYKDLTPKPEATGTNFERVARRQRREPPPRASL